MEVSDSCRVFSSGHPRCLWTCAGLGALLCHTPIFHRLADWPRSKILSWQLSCFSEFFHEKQLSCFSDLTVFSLQLELFLLYYAWNSTSPGGVTTRSRVSKTATAFSIASVETTAARRPGRGVPLGQGGGRVEGGINVIMVRLWNGRGMDLWGAIMHELVQHFSASHAVQRCKL